MAWEGPQIIIPGLTASTDLSNRQFYFVRLSGAATVTTCTAPTDIPIGVLQNNPRSGAGAEVCTLGVTKVSSDEALTAGWFIGTSIDGQADRKIIGTDVTEYIAGQVIVATTAVGGIATVVVNCINPPRAVTSN
ncbi:MAG: hypothetical protein DDT21_01850 [Syntrophomonadaceae bacterium]|nr:hypothetical protein [Bacillota bacterium]